MQENEDLKSMLKDVSENGDASSVRKYFVSKVSGNNLEGELLKKEETILEL